MVKQLEDGTATEKTSEELAQEFQISPREASILIGVMQLNLDNWDIPVCDIEVQTPMRPAIITLIMCKQKGCREWAKLLKHKHGVSPGVREREVKWETYLGLRLSIKYWDACASKMYKVSISQPCSIGTIARCIVNRCSVLLV